MSVKETILQLEKMKKDPENSLSPEDHQALFLALVVLRTQSIQQEALIDAIMALDEG